MNLNLEKQKPDIKISVRQTFNLDSDMEIDGFSNKNKFVQRLTTIINLTGILLLQFFLVLHLIKSFNSRLSWNRKINSHRASGGKT